MKPEIAETTSMDEAVRAARLNQSASTVVLPTINVSRFQTLFSPSPVCVARYMPASLDIPHLKLLAPSPELLQRWRDSDKSKESWNSYTRQYWSEISYRWGRNPYICRETSDNWIHGGVPRFSRSKYLAFVLKAAARKMGVNELTLCCYEQSKDEHCHRKLIFDALPRQMKGFRA